MFKMASNKEIGEYLEKEILDIYKSKREFCRRYLKLQYEKTEVEEAELQNLANRVTQITGGKKQLMPYDLPLFCELLDMSCEQILSAGKCFTGQKSRMTNYSVALSEDEQLWTHYINHENKMILNTDEYGKTILDYAVEYKNYRLLRFLLDRGYIWFDSGNENDYVLTFGAGTSIQRRNICMVDTDLSCRTLQQDQLRMDITALAVENGDREVLDRLRAREIPELYYKAHFLNYAMPEINKHKNRILIEQAAKASKEIVEYFTDTFPVRDYVKYKDGSEREHRFLFPYISDLLELLVKNGHEYTASALKKCIAHNNAVYSSLKQLMTDSLENEVSRLNISSLEYQKTVKGELIGGLNRDFAYSENGNIVIFRAWFGHEGLITNIAEAKTNSKDPQIQMLIDDLNESFTKIKTLPREFTQRVEGNL